MRELTAYRVIRSALIPHLDERGVEKAAKDVFLQLREAATDHADGGPALIDFARPNGEFVGEQYDPEEWDDDWDDDCEEFDDEDEEFPAGVPYC